MPSRLPWNPWVTLQEPGLQGQANSPLCSPHPLWCQPCSLGFFFFGCCSLDKQIKWTGLEKTSVAGVFADFPGALLWPSAALRGLPEQSRRTELQTTATGPPRVGQLLRGDDKPASAQALTPGALQPHLGGRGTREGREADGPVTGAWSQVPGLNHSPALRPDMRG